MALQVISNRIDAAGFRRVVIQNDANLSQTIALKFPPGLTVQQMKDIAQVKIDDEIARRAVLVARQATLDQITANVGLHQQGRLNATQQAQLLTALCAEWRGGNA